MSSIKIDINNIKSTNQSLKILSSELTDIENSLSSIRLSLDHRIAQRGNIDRRLSQTVKSMDELEMKLKKMHIFIDESMDQYIEADKKAKFPPLKKEKSVWNQFLDGLTTAYDSTKGFISGLSDSVVSTVDGLWQVIRHPIKTTKGLVYIVQHPVKTGEAIWQTIKESWNKDVINGDAESSSHWFGRAFGEAALALVGTKGVDKAVKLTRGTELIKEVGGVKVTYGIHDGEKLVNRRNEVNINNNIVNGTSKEYPTRQIDPVKESHIIDKVKELRGNLTSKYKKSGNFALAEVEIAEISKKEFYAQSKIDSLSGELIDRVPEISLQPDNPIFKATEAAGQDGKAYMRDSDTEYKILNDIAYRLGDNTQVSGKINLFTELDTCDSCNRIIAEFSAKYPNIKLEVIHNNGERIKP